MCMYYMCTYIHTHVIHTYSSDFFFFGQYRCACVYLYIMKPLVEREFSLAFSQ